MHLLATLGLWFLGWFLIGCAFLIFWSALAWVGDQIGAARWLKDEVEDARHRESDLDKIWCPRCGRLDGSHSPACMAEFTAARQHRLVKR